MDLSGVERLEASIRGVAGGLLVFLGLSGTVSQINSLVTWSGETGVGYIAFVVLVVNVSRSIIVRKANAPGTSGLPG